MASIVLLLIVLHGWVGWRIAPALAHWSPIAEAAMWVLLCGSALLIPLGFMSRRRLAGTAPAHAIVWAAFISMGFFSTLLVLTLLRDALLVVALAAAVGAQRIGLPPVPLDALQAWSAAVVPILAWVATAWGLHNARKVAQVTRVDVPIAGLPDALHGFSVVQISDIHVGPTIGEAYLQRIVERVNALNGDMVAITGDLVDGSVHDLRMQVAPLSQLVSRHGSFFVTGNHEYYSGAHAWIDELRGLGVQVLLNEHRVLHHASPRGQMDDIRMHGGEPEMVVVAGVADFSAHHFDASHRSDPVAAMRGAPAAARLRLLLAHQPRSALAAVDAGYDLQLSGHTHGGQFWPWMYFVRFQQPFTAGLRKLGSLWVYTNRGTGYWGPPKRLGVTAEITFLRLVRA
ncbi:MAG: metallophosphoesterase [Burkholderiaceae bacterium]